MIVKKPSREELIQNTLTISGLKINSISRKQLSKSKNERDMQLTSETVSQRNTQSGGSPRHKKVLNPLPDTKEEL